MGNLLYTIAIVLIIIWAISFFKVYAIGGLIHLFLLIALIVFILRVIQGDHFYKIMYENYYYFEKK